MSEFTRIWRIEPRASSNAAAADLSTPIHDPLWFLTRQWQMGEFRGEDTGSLAYVEWEQTSAAISRWRAAGTQPLLPLGNAPLERQVLDEGFEPDFATQVELAHDFSDLLQIQTGQSALTQAILAQLLTKTEFKLKAPVDDNLLNPINPASKRFALVCASETLDGIAVLAFGQAVAAGTRSVSEVTTTPAHVAPLQAALGAFVARVRQVFGRVGNQDPLTWQPKRLQYGVQVAGLNPGGAAPGGQGASLMNAVPDQDGRFEWFSFDVAGALAAAPDDPALKTKRSFAIPTRVFFDGMPARRYWNFENHRMPIPEVATEADDLLKLLAMHHLMVHTNDWYVLASEQSIAARTRTQYVVVHDVFGQQTLIRRADADQFAESPARFTLFSISDDSVSSGGISPDFICPPSPGPALQLGNVLEDVRFGRDEMANMAWGIERTTQSAITGEPRSGNERATQVEQWVAEQPASGPTITSNFSLRYSIQSRVPYNWVPLLPVQLDPNNPSIVLRRGRALSDLGPLQATASPAVGSILNPSQVTGHYDVDEEELPRSGLRIERVVCRSRWSDGSSHLWVQRRRRVGAGESQAALQFDRALPNETPTT